MAEAEAGGGQLFGFDLEGAVFTAAEFSDPPGVEIIAQGVVNAAPKATARGRPT
jgi:hypothetical protein